MPLARNNEDLGGLSRPVGVVSGAPSIAVIGKSHRFVDGGGGRRWPGGEDLKGRRGAWSAISAIGEDASLMSGWTLNAIALSLPPYGSGACQYTTVKQRHAG